MSPGINLFYGMNGQGKTNILEAIEILSTTRSGRAFRENELIRHGCDEAWVGGKFEKKSLDFDIEICYRNDRRKACRKNDKPVSADSVFGMVNIVKFFPDDVEIIRGSPQVRRKYADMEISITDGVFYSAYKDYVRIIENRNRFLKKLFELREGTAEYSGTMNALESYDSLIPGIAYSVAKGRAAFLKQISRYATPLHREFSGGGEEIGVKYMFSDFENGLEFENITEDEYKNRLTFLLKKNLKSDIIKGHTGAGPHRDDIEFLINGSSARSFGSTGQIRTLAISLKMAQIEYVFDKTSDHPVLLIDDLTSEFDTQRLFKIVSSISNRIQVLITCTNQKLFLDSWSPAEMAQFEVDSGNVEKKK